MNTPRTLLVVNPAAGAGRAGRVLSRVLEELKPWGEFEIAVTRAGEVRPAERIVREAVANGVTRIAVLGGDGTASQALNGLRQPGGSISNVQLGLIPAGTGRDFARTVGISRKPIEAARHLARAATTRTIDVGQIELSDGSVRLFLNIASFGVTARIAHALEQYPQLKRHAGALAFGLATVRAGLNYAPDLVEARVDTHAPERGPVAAMAIANGAWFGGGMHVAPTARIDDGRFEVVRFGDIARSDFVVSLPLVYKGTHYAHPKVTVSQGSDVFAAPAGGEGARAVEIEADGEIVGQLPARFSIRRGAIALLV
ncbi:MAG: diacylglycerol kinase family lipid kinase [bacterium]|nr:diacylglycerol kinase family lipid kinase [Candidatus Aquidulcis frankliniae]